MHESDLADLFEQQRPRLLAIATRALGSSVEAEDAVQEVWLRLARHANDPIDNLGAWLTRVLGRICIDALRRRTTRAEHPLYEQADPIVTVEEGPEEAAVAADAVGLALLVVLDSLSPEERLAFVLHDVFRVPFAEIGPVVGRTADAAKMLASRARRKVRQRGPLPSGGVRERRAVVDAFLAAARDGDFDRLLTLLHPDITWRRVTARGETTSVGPGELLSYLRRGTASRIEARRVSVDGEPGILAWGPSGRPLALMACTVSGGRIVHIDSIADPNRLARMQLPDRPSVQDRSVQDRSVQDRSAHAPSVQDRGTQDPGRTGETSGDGRIAT